MAFRSDTMAWNTFFVLIRCGYILLWLSWYKNSNLTYSTVWNNKHIVVDSVDGSQHYYHARYPSDDWHLAYMFSLAYFSVEVCLVGVFPHSVSTRQIPASGSMHPSRWLPPSREKKVEQGGWPGSLLDPSKGVFELTYGSDRIKWKINYPAILVAG